MPINTAYKGQYLRHQLGDSGARVVVVQRTLADRVAAVIDDLPDLEHVIVVDDREEPGAGSDRADGQGDGARVGRGARRSTRRLRP